MLAHQRSRGTGFDHCVGVSPEGRERGGEGRERNGKRRGNTEGEGGASREKTWREREGSEGVAGLGGRWWKCFCALCEM